MLAIRTNVSEPSQPLSTGGHGHPIDLKAASPLWRSTRILSEENLQAILVVLSDVVVSPNLRLNTPTTFTFNFGKLLSQHGIAALAVHLEVEAPSSGRIWSIVRHLEVTKRARPTGERRPNFPGAACTTQQGIHFAATRATSAVCSHQA
jgi:hypothetical protein